MEKYILFGKNLEDFSSDSEIIENKDLISYEVKIIEDLFILEQLLNLAIEFGEFRFISEDTYHELAGTWDS